MGRVPTYASITATDDPTHLRYRVEPRGHHVEAACTCGWRSLPASSGGLAGAMWDRHVERVDRLRRN